VSNEEEKGVKSLCLSLYERETSPPRERQRKKRYILI
jgi:hypothetical protein